MAVTVGRGGSRKSTTRTGQSPSRGQHAGSRRPTRRRRTTTSRRSGGGGGGSRRTTRRRSTPTRRGGTTSRSTRSPSTTNKTPGISSIEAKELAALAGFSVAFFKHNNELKNVFEKALRQDWSGDRLLAAARNTNWFKKHSESARRAILLKTSDPAEYKRQLKQTRAAARRIIRELGVPIDGFTLGNVAKAALHGGWNETQIRNYVTKFGSVADAIRAGKTLRGLAGETERELRELSNAYGIGASTNFVANATQRVVRNRRDMEFYRNHFLERAMSRYPGLAKELEGGLTVAQIAEPYVDAMARLLELNPGDINVFDKSIQKALISRDSKGKPAAKTLWQFEEDLRKDARWMKTNNAREDLMSAGRQVLRDLGLSF